MNIERTHCKISILDISDTELSTPYVESTLMFKMKDWDYIIWKKLWINFLEPNKEVT